MRKKILIIGFFNDYDLLDIQLLKNEYDVNHYIIPKIIRSFYVRFRKVFPSISSEMIKIILLRIRNINEYNVVIFDDSIISFDIISNEIIQDVFNNRVIVILRNIINDNYREEVVLYYREMIDFYSFDMADCNKFKIKKYNQYCSGYEQLQVTITNDEIFDLYFLGLDKGRVENVTKIVESLPLYSSNVIFIYNPIDFFDFIQKKIGCKKFNYIPYKKHLSYILESKVILDIVQDGQSGITMRTLEAIISNKKVITNNKNILNEKFYNEKQIFIVDDFENLPIDKICEFIDTPLELFNYHVSNFSIIDVYKKILG